MNKRTMTRLIALAGLALAGLAGAEEAAAPAAKPKRADKGQQAGFAAADLDGDGTLSLTEFTAMQNQRREAMKARLGDKFDAAKAAKMPDPAKQFAELDKNADGRLTAEEFAAGRPVRGREKDAAAKKTPPAGKAATAPAGEGE
jgi:hypothetical protein